MIIEMLLVTLILIVLFLAKEIVHLKTKILNEWVKEIESNTNKYNDSVHGYKHKLVTLHTEIRKAAMDEKNNDALLKLWDISNELVKD